ncbi:unnamed protein product [Soboliphyme baturini]|uniref:FERM domain-containing protein n=1 Tax=Soboliphyme baturini TaxID=241478 RepID=A0A183J6R6_9BILA|nr:unnamed protein product [Soboliphyme baturini]
MVRFIAAITSKERVDDTPKASASPGFAPSAAVENQEMRECPVMVGPEFLYRSQMPSIALKALNSEVRNAAGIHHRKFFRKSHATSVVVDLLNGQRVDVACKTGCVANDIFEVVSTHTNLTERHFFGLAFLRDGEYYFLEPEQKIGRFAPPGWRHSDQSRVRTVYHLYLRLKYYPIGLTFIKTEQTMHQVYLQLRRDIMDSGLQCGDVAVAMKLAAVALQVEMGDYRLNEDDRFSVEHYLPKVIV